ncbi:hypothetical protein LC55x_0896 [Lysobacter capsici]|nr:hypothetical protein LC55x_0896 [Lysobacter capsici]
MKQHKEPCRKAGFFFGRGLRRRSFAAPIAPSWMRDCGMDL